MSEISLKIAQIKNLLVEKFPSVRLVVVTKSRSVEEISQALVAGATIIAENRVQEAKEKFELLKNDSHWQDVEKHLIGHLQTNKAKEAVQLFDLIQSVDSLRLAEKINEEAAKLNKVMPILLQVNISADEQKSGFSVDDLWPAYQAISQLKNIKVQGLMTITQDYEEQEAVKKDFQKMKILFDDFCAKTDLKDAVLSMGMSNDFELALQCGSNMIRVGSYIFM